jgi:hypothetical protein
MGKERIVYTDVTEGADWGISNSYRKKNA